MRKKIGIIVGCWLAGAVWIGCGGLNHILDMTGEATVSVVEAGTNTSSKDIQKQIDAVNKKKETAQQEKKQLEKDIASIETKKSNVLEYVESLDGKLTELSGKIEANQNDIATTKKKITKLRKEKKQAESEKKKQYDTMTRRIKYMYENGNTGYLELLLGSNSLSELFNRAEYVNKVTNYDNNMFKNYQSVCQKITRAEKKVNDSLTSLEQFRGSLKVEKASVNVLMDKKQAELEKYQSLIQDKSSSVKEQEQLLAKQDDELENLLAQQRKKAEEEEKTRKAAEEKKKQQAANKPSRNTTDSSNNSSHASGDYSWPLAVSGTITSYFGYRKSPTPGASSYHKGIDIAVPVGTSVLAAKGGKVVTAAYSSSAGNYIAIYHGDGIYSYYMHCSSLSVRQGASVSKGQQVALSGNTGVSTGPHLHFAIYANGAYVNPLSYVSQ